VYSFGQPATTGEVDHKRVEGKVLHIDVGELARETRKAVENWIQVLESSPDSVHSRNVAQNLPSLVRVVMFKAARPTIGGVTPWIAKTTSDY
jgi:DNA phosphorothioation-dependent restriction protein DptG